MAVEDWEGLVKTVVARAFPGHRDVDDLINAGRWAVWLHEPRYDADRGGMTITSYLAVKVHQAAVDRYRELNGSSRKPAGDRPRTVGWGPTADRASGERPPIERMIDRQEAARLLLTLPAERKTRRIFRRRFLLGEPRPQVADRYGISLGSLDQRINRHAKKLRQAYGVDHGGPFARYTPLAYRR